MRPNPFVCLLAVALVPALLVAPLRAEEGERGWEFLSRSAIGASRFTDAHPTWDGRGVLVAVCDSGTELGLPGLAETSDGKPKVLDARVFSDEGVVSLAVAKREQDDGGAYWQAAGKRRLYGADAVPVAPPDDGQVLLGWFEETTSRAGRMRDLDGDGRSDGVFGVVAFRAAGTAASTPWTAYVDTDRDGRVDDEQPIQDYAIARDTFRLSSGGPEPHTEQRVLYALNLDPKAKEAALYFGGGHGTHVAGIVAGHRLNGQDAFHGIAPGAQLLALKIGAEGLSGGATTPGSMLRAWRYAVEKARELDLPLVIQMSYGVGSEDEGTSVAERLIDDLLRKHPEVAATVSAGNEGPGISTIGLPSCANEPLSIGAAIPTTTARDVYAVDIPDHRMFGFSSRGGEVAKPEVVCPGFAASSVPDWFGGRDVMGGTSMAAPQGAGACALVYSAAKAEGLPIRRDLLRAALIRTARPLPGYGPIDYGAGMVDVPRAFECYRALAARGEHAPLAWKIETESPESHDGRGPTIYYRGDYYPRGGAVQEIDISPVFPKGTQDDAKQRAFTAFDFRCDARWVRLGKDASYTKQSASATLPVRFVEEHLQHPGLYQTEILGFAKSGGAGTGPGAAEGPEFRIPVAIVVPHRLETLPGGVLRYTTPGLDTSIVDRVFLHVPRRVGSVSIKARLRNDAPGQDAYPSLFDGEGRRQRLPVLNAKDPEWRRTFTTDDLEPGVWELCVAGARGTAQPVTVDLEIRALGLAAPLVREVTLTHEAGKSPEGAFDLTASVVEPWRGRGSGRVVGVTRGETHAVRGPKLERTYRLAPGETGLELGVELSAADWGKFTDFSMRLIGPDGEAVRADALGYRRGRLHFQDAAAKGAYKLELYGGTADPGDAKVSWSVHIRETRLYADAVRLSLRQRGKGEITLYPDRETPLSVHLSAVPPVPPDGHVWRAEITLKPDAGEAPELAFGMDLLQR